MAATRPWRRSQLCNHGFATTAPFAVTPFTAPACKLDTPLANFFEVLEAALLSCVAYRFREEVHATWQRRELPILAHADHRPLVVSGHRGLDMMVHKQGTVAYVTFRGAEPWDEDWLGANVFVHLAPFTVRGKQYGLVHGGFLGQFSSVADGIESTLAVEYGAGISSVVFSGRSLGGALATIAAAYFGKLVSWGAYSCQVTCISIGSTGVGNAAFAAQFAAVVPRSFLIQAEGDLIVGLLGHDYVHTAGVRVRLPKAAGSAPAVEQRGAEPNGAVPRKEDSVRDDNLGDSYIRRISRNFCSRLPSSEKLRRWLCCVSAECLAYKSLVYRTTSQRFHIPSTAVNLTSADPHRKGPYGTRIATDVHAHLTLQAQQASSGRKAGSQAQASTRASHAHLSAACKWPRDSCTRAYHPSGARPAACSLP